MTDQIYRFFLTFSHEMIVIFTIMIAGLLFGNRKLFFNAICLGFFAVILNKALKITFHIPLNPALHKIGYAFPSGHMQTATTFYGWLLIFSENLFLKIILSVLLIGIGAGLIHFGYHNLNDILGAIFFSILTIYFYKIICKKYSYIAAATTLCIVNIVLIAYIFLSQPCLTK